MASRDYAYDTSTFLDQDMESEWNQDTSQYLWDSPQPDPGSSLSFKSSEAEAEGIEGNTRQVKLEDTEVKDWAKTNPTPVGAIKGSLSSTSSASGLSSHSSSSTSSGRRKRKVATNYNQSSLQASNASATPADPSDLYKIPKDYIDSNYNFLSGETSFPGMGVGMDSLSLDTAGNLQTPKYEFDTVMTSPTPSPAGLYADVSEAFSQPTVSPTGQTLSAPPVVSPQMTIQPSKAFFVGPSQENSPESTTLMNSQESSPVPHYGHVYSSLYPDGSGLSDEFAKTTQFGNNAYASRNGKSGNSSISDAKNSAAHALNASKGSSSLSSLFLKVDAIPEKSRVETQIPIRLTIQNVPAGVTKLHLPSYAISKPKYQTKPLHTPSPDTLELSAMLVCTSAMQKDGARERALQNAAKDLIPEWNEDYQPQTGANNQADDNDPMRPLNGGPVAICPTCINRERKRAARKKTKKADEEEEWAKDEAKRVIVFNCPEIKDWCVPGSKETAVKDSEESLDSMFVNIPMRIACYCRHHGEKLGFQVIFTIKSPEGEVLGQAECQSIMITDDHKQPIASGAHQAASFPSKINTQMTGPSLFMPNQQMQTFNSSFPQSMPFRHSVSTPSLPMLQTYYASQRRPQAFQLDPSNEVQPQYNTATATPRNLSRPASPTAGDGHSTKKRRSAGSIRGKVPTNLAMTRIENMSPNSADNPMISGPSSAGPSATHFAFSPSGTTSFGPMLGQHYQQMTAAAPYSFQSGPSTPSLAGPMPGSAFGPPTVDDMYQFYSAPTSQHPSRAPSPNSTNRFSGSVSFTNHQVPQQAALALASLPPGINLQKPPIIQRLIPSAGSRNGGEEVTILGSGFCQGLEVMFGDVMASNTTYWGDTTLVCVAPPAATVGKVAVVFQHQHHSGSQALQQLQGLMPTQILSYEYFDDDRNQMDGLSMSVISRGQHLGNGELSSGKLASTFLSSSNRFGDQKATGTDARGAQQRPLSGGSSSRSVDGSDLREYLK